MIHLEPLIKIIKIKTDLNKLEKCDYLKFNEISQKLLNNNGVGKGRKSF